MRRNAAAREKGDCHPSTGVGRAPARPVLRSGHRRKYDPRAEPERSFADRIDGAVKDVAVFRAVAWSDLAEIQFGGNKFAARRGVAHLEASGWVKREKAKGPRGGEFTVLVATAAGAERAEALLARALRTQQVHYGTVKVRELGHDAAVYRSAMAEVRRIEGYGGRIRQFRIDAELKAELARESERVRRTAGAAVAAEHRQYAAEALSLPVGRDGHVMIPDAQIEYADASGRIGRCNVEVATEHYSGQTIREKAAAGFVVKGATPAAARAVARALGGDSAEGKRRGGRPRREEEVIEL